MDRTDIDGIEAGRAGAHRLEPARHEFFPAPWSCPRVPGLFHSSTAKAATDQAPVPTSMSLLPGNHSEQFGFVVKND